MVLALAAGDVLDGLFDSIDADGGWLSLPVIGSFLAALGFGGALVLQGTDLPATAAAGVGLAAGAIMALLAARVTRAFFNMPTDATPKSADVVGRDAQVVTPIAAGRLGEILVALGGQRVKFAARADRDLPVGTAVVIVAIESATAVRVEPTEQFWAKELTEQDKDR